MQIAPGQNDEAPSIFERMLFLNPPDKQGARFFTGHS